MYCLPDENGFTHNLIENSLWHICENMENEAFAPEEQLIQFP